MTEVNIPLLRKAVEWAEAEAAKPVELCEWSQEWWVSPPDQREMLDNARAAECGTCYCIAGFIAAISLREGESISGGVRVVSEDGDSQFISDRATREIGGEAYGDGEWLFTGSNTIEDVRRIAESIAGESL